MQPRPLRSQIYLPVLRFGITDEDWGIVLIASVVGYAVPFFLNLRIYQLPLELLGWLLAMGVSILILNLIRRKQRPSWLKHTLQWRLRPRTQRRWRPDKFYPDWLRPAANAPAPPRLLPPQQAIHAQIKKGNT